MSGLKNFLNAIYENWTAIMVAVGTIVVMVNRMKRLFSKDEKERLDLAKREIKETILHMVTKAEIDYKQWAKSGSIKRAQVIRTLFEDYPILSTFIEKEDIIKWIDETIDESLKTLRKIVGNSTPR